MQLLSNCSVAAQEAGLWDCLLKKMEERGIDPLTSRMLSERSTI